MKPGRWQVVAGLLVAGAIGLGAASSAWADDSVTPMCNAQTCANGWYTAPVTLTWQVSTTPPPNKYVGCDEILATAQDAVAATTCEALWSSDDIKRTYTVHVELSNPTAAAIPIRSPDENGWYNHPLSVSFTGGAFSGIARCSDPLTYAGPSAANATVTGSCTDNAGKTANARMSFRYDATPPKITGATASRPPDYKGWYTRPVSFTFKGTDPLSGIASCQTATFSGARGASLTGGCWDRAGNYGSMALPIRFLHVVNKASHGRISGAPVLLSWSGANGASYYNVQLYRASHKLLSRWPSRTSLFLGRTWRFDGGRYGLKPGTYHWYVWPGYGSPAADSYGAMIVSATFTVG